MGIGESTYIQFKIIVYSINRLDSSYINEKVDL